MILKVITARINNVFLASSMLLVAILSTALLLGASAHPLLVSSLVVSLLWQAVFFAAHLWKLAPVWKEGHYKLPRNPLQLFFTVMFFRTPETWEPASMRSKEINALMFREKDVTKRFGRIAYANQNDDIYYKLAKPHPSLPLSLYALAALSCSEILIKDKSSQSDEMYALALDNVDVKKYLKYPEMFFPGVEHSYFKLRNLDDPNYAHLKLLAELEQRTIGRFDRLRAVFCSSEKSHEQCSLREDSGPLDRRLPLAQAGMQALLELTPAQAEIASVLVKDRFPLTHRRPAHLCLEDYLPVFLTASKLA